MLKTVEAIVEKDGRVRLLEAVHLPHARRALLTILEEEHGTGAGEARAAAEGEPEQEGRSSPKRGEGSAQELLRSPLAGLWKERDDLPSSSAYARRLRERAERRSG